MLDPKARPSTVLMLFARTFAAAIALGGCVSVPSYPSDWAPVTKSEGPCPNLSGTYANNGDVAPDDAPKRDLVGLVSGYPNIPAGDTVTRIAIIQTQDAISIEAFNADRRLGHWAYRLISMDEARPGIDPTTVASCFMGFVGITLMSEGSSQLEAPYTAIREVGARFRKATDGSLIVQLVHFQFGVVLVPGVLMPSNYARRDSLYRFPAVEIPTIRPSGSENSSSD